MDDLFEVERLPIGFWWLLFVTVVITVVGVGISMGWIPYPNASTIVKWESGLATLMWLIVAVALYDYGGWKFATIKWLGHPDTCLMAAWQGLYPIRIAARYFLGAVFSGVLALNAFLALLWSLKIMHQNSAILWGVVTWGVPILLLIMEEAHYRLTRLRL